MAINRTDLQFLDQAFRKLLTSTGIKDGLFEDVFTSISNSQITEPLTLYVETTGDDVNGSGTKNSPYRTIQKALDYLRTFRIKATVTVQVGVGTFDGFVYPSFDLDSVGPTSSVVVVRGTPIAATLTTGTTTGTANFSNNNTITDLSQNWTSGELKGKFIKMANATTYYLIVDNTSTTIIVSNTGIPASGVSYEILTNGTVIDCNKINNSLTPFTAGIVLESNGSSNLSAAKFSLIKLDAGVGTGVVFFTNNVSATFTACEFKVSPVGTSTSAFSGLSGATAGGCLIFTRCFFNLQKTSSNAFSCLGGNGLSVTPLNCYFLGSDKTQTAFVSGSYCLQSANVNVFENLGYCFGSNLSAVTAYPFVNWAIMGTFINCGTVCWVQGSIKISDSKLNLPSFPLSSSGNTNFVYIDKYAKVQIQGYASGLAATDLTVNGATSTLAAMGPVFPSSPNAYGSCVYT